MIETSEPVAEIGGLSKAERAYEALRRAILKLELRPGELLKEPDLMQRLGVGRTPVREALQRLAADGLVTVLPHRGTLVSTISPNDIKALFELRRELDAFAARLAADRATPEDLARMQALVTNSHQFDEDPEEYDRRVHELIAAAGHNPYVQSTWRRVYGLSVWMINLLEIRRESVEDMRRELAVVCEAIAARDGEAAAQAAGQHVLGRGWFQET